MASLAPLSQLSSGNPAYESYYRQVDPANTGKVGSAEAAQFLKKSGLSDSTLRQIWDLSDPEGKGYLDKRGFFTALRLVASAQGGSEVTLNSLNQNVSSSTPTFRDAASPSLNITASAGDSTWAVKPEEKAKYDGIFESLSPVGGLLSGDKVKPVLMNSNLPLDVLGKIWDLSDIDKDGHLDKEEFSVAMHLVYAAREKEPVPSTLPTSLIPPPKRKKIPAALPGSVPVLPSSPFLLKENLRPTPPISKSLLSSSTTNLSPSNSFRSSTPTPLQPQKLTQASSEKWVVPEEDRGQYEEIFELADSDFDGLVGGGEVKDIFMNSKLPQSVLAHIWSLADTKSTGKLTQEQFCLAMHLIQETVKGVEPPQSLSPDMIPPSERGAAPTPILSGFTPSVSELPPIPSLSRDSGASVGLVELTGIKDLDDISQEISQLQSEKHTLQTEIRQKEETLRQKNSEIQGTQRELDLESLGLHEMEHQKGVAQDRLLEMEQQRSKLESTLEDAKNKWEQENTKISSLQGQILSQESEMQSQEKDLNRTKMDLYCMEQEEQRLETSLREGKAKLESILKLLKTSQDEMDQTRGDLSEIQETQRELNNTIERYAKALNDSMTSLSELDRLISEDGSAADAMEDSLVKSRMAMFNNSSSSSSSSSPALNADPFQTEDPFKSHPFSKADPFGGDPFQQNDPFKDPFSNSDPFSESSASQFQSSPFSRRSRPTSVSPKPKNSDPFASSDPFSGDSFGGRAGFADFSRMSKGSTAEPIGRKPTYPLPPPKKPGPARPAPPPYGQNSAVSYPGSAAHSQPFTAPAARKTQKDRGSHSSSPSFRSAVNPSSGVTDLRAFGNEMQQLEWAKRESQREEAERIKRLRLQEQQDLELALALSRAEMPRT